MFFDQCRRRSARYVAGWMCSGYTNPHTGPHNFPLIGSGAFAMFGVRGLGAFVMLGVRWFCHVGGQVLFSCWGSGAFVMFRVRGSGAFVVFGMEWSGAASGMWL